MALFHKPKANIDSVSYVDATAFGGTNRTSTRGFPATYTTNGSGQIFVTTAGTSTNHSGGMPPPPSIDRYVLERICRRYGRIPEDIAKVEQDTIQRTLCITWKQSIRGTAGMTVIRDGRPSSIVAEELWMNLSDGTATVEPPSLDWYWVDEKNGNNFAAEYGEKSFPIRYKTTCPECLEEFTAKANGATSNKDLAKLLFRLGGILTWHRWKEHQVSFEE